ncbi:hypothetical protein EV424DRAFT_1378728 [Suillus variegatus]|nr:hypothetical protein EV424DRAFT_1378728 [Suillus variegatus]
MGEERRPDGSIRMRVQKARFAGREARSMIRTTKTSHPRISTTLCIMGPVMHKGSDGRGIACGIVKRAGLGNLKGHGLRIGGTLEYLLRGVPFDVVKSMGRWSSEAFTVYLRKHALILAPYLQESSALEPFTRYTMPPIR